MTEPTASFEPVEAPGDLAVALGNLSAAPEYADWPQWAKDRRDHMLARMAGGERPPHMAAGLYAMAKAGIDIGAAGWTAVAQAAEVTARHRLTDLGKDGTAQQLVDIARRERGEEGPHPDPEDDPVIPERWTAGWLPAPEPEEEPEPEPGPE